MTATKWLQVNGVQAGVWAGGAVARGGILDAVREPDVTVPGNLYNKRLND
jgi:hypothetical protein